MNVVYALLQWIVLIVIRLGLIVLGLAVVAVALPFRKQEFSLKYPDWPITNLPRWAWLFGNDYDGLQGDIRGWWNDNADQYVLFGLFPLLRKIRPSLRKIDGTHPLSMWWWAAIRNPVNNLRLVSGFNCPVDECDITYAGHEFVADKPGVRAWQFVTAQRSTGISRWFGFYASYAFSPTRAMVVRLGYKVEPRHVGTNEAKGMTFKLNPYKSI